MWGTVMAMLIGGGLTYLLNVSHDRGRRLEGWKKAAASCGLEVVEAFSGWSPRLKARAGLVHVRFQSSGDQGRFTLIAVEAPAPPDFHSVTIRPESGLELGREIEIGDKNFDDKFFIQGPVRLVLALLDAEMRRLLLDSWEKYGISIAAGQLQAHVLGEEKIVGALRLLLGVYQRFAPPFNVLERLVANATEDPDPGIRRRNLLLLIRELSWSPETDRALRKACSDPVPEIRLRAARQLGAEGRETLLALAEGLEDDAVSAEALALVDRELPFERVSAILGHALRRRRLQTALVCLEAIGRRGAAAGIELLEKVIEREHNELAPAAAEALGAIGSPDAEPALIQALLHDDAELRVAAARALGRAGSATAVLPLKEAAERSRLDLELRRATRQAIAEIHSRVQGASPGQLSLAGADAGQLSLAEAEEGQLSLAKDPGGQLSISSDRPDAAPVDSGGTF